MEPTGRAGKISAAVLGLGIGAAVVAGVGAPIARADETSGSTGRGSTGGSPSASDTGTDRKSPDSGASTSAVRPTTSGDTDGPTRPRADHKAKPTKTSAGAATPGQFDTADPAVADAPDRKSATGRKKHSAPDTIERATPVTDSDATPPKPTASGPTTAPEPQTDAAVDADVPAVTEMTLTAPTPVAPDTEPQEPAALSPSQTTVVRAVAADTSNANPAGSPVSPATPVALSQLWTAAATTRRETASVGGTLATLAATDSTSEPAVKAVSSATVENSLTYTAGPSLTDQITVAALRVLRTVSDVIGVDLFGLGGKALVMDSPPFFLTGGLDVEKTTYTAADGEVWQVWEFHPDNPTSKTVVALHGGGFILQPNIMHWMDYTNMARDTGATVIVPLYPLATTEAGSAVRVIPTIADFITEQINQHGAENVSIYGDSSGANLAMLSVRELILRGDELPSDIVLVSLGPDASLSNPDIATIDDPVFNLNNLDFYSNGNHWRDGLSDDDPMMNQLLFEDSVLQAFPQTTIYQGALEFSLPDIMLLHQRAVDLEAPISVVIGKGQIHDWALGAPINSQAMVVRNDIYRQLGLTGIDSNTITYTAAPSLTDQLTVFVLRAMSTISRAIGVDIYGQIGKLMANASPQPWMLGGLTAVKTTYTTADGAAWKVWELIPPNPSGKAVIAVHGGGFILEPILTHWIDYTNMARDTGATVIIPIYPLATTEAGTATVVIPAMADFVSEQIDRFGAENVSMYADSAGPTLALGAVRLLILAGKPIPASMVMLSFEPAGLLSNPDAYAIDDPVVDLNNVDFYTTVNHWWDGLSDKNDPLISPMSYEPEVLAALPPTMIYVGDLELALPDSLLFQQKAVAAGGTMSVVVGRGQIHDWALGAPVNSQSAVVRRDIYRELGLVDTATTSV